MLIAVDGNEANVQEKVGVSLYTYNILNYFKEYSNQDLRFLIYLKNKPLKGLPQETPFYKYEIVHGPFLWSQFFLPINLYKKLFFKDKIDNFFSPAHYAPRFCPYKSVITIHDLSYFYYPADFLKKDLYKLRSWTAYSVKNAQKIIAVSKTTKKDLIKFYDIPEEKIAVVYNGFEKPNSDTCQVNSRLHPREIDREEKYILYVGTIQPRKNITTLIQAFNIFKKENPEFKLVLVGKKGWLFEEIFAEVKKLNLEKDVIFTGYLPDNEVVDLYTHAFCFVMPSFYEGFGIPLLEAMSYSCPVISSFASSLPEVGADACLYFDPKSDADLLDRLKLLKENASIRFDLIKKGKERVKLFSWDTCAKQTLEILKSAADKNSI